jgi:hypothetical protein
VRNVACEDIAKGGSRSPYRGKLSKFDVMKGLSLLLALVIICAGCDYFNSNNAQKRIKEAFAETNDSLKQNYNNERTSLKNMYQNISGKIKDTVINKKINTYYSALNGVIIHMDSLKKGIDTADESTIKDNSDKGAFVNDNVKYRLFEKLRQLYIQALDVAKTNKMKFEIMKSRENLLFSSDVKQLVDFYFGQNDAQQQTWVLYGFESEIMKIGINCFKDYSY